MKKIDISKDEVEWLYYEEGMNVLSISRYYSVSRDVILRIIEPERLKLNSKNFRDNHKEEIREDRKIYYKTHKVEIMIYLKNYQKNCSYLTTGIQGARHLIRVKDNQNK